MSEKTLSLPVYSGLPGASKCQESLSSRLGRLQQVLSQLPEKEAKEYFQIGPEKKALKTTISLCPDCLEPVVALVYSDQGRVFLRKDCLAHGPSTVLLENDENFYFLSNRDQWGKRFAAGRLLEIPAFEGSCCGGGSCGEGNSESELFTDQTGNKTCTILVEITDACNLACQVCYADAKGDRQMPLETFQNYLNRLIEQKGVLDSVQITGGEAILHPQFWEMVAFLHAHEGVKKIYLPTNGILFAKREVAERLEPFRDKIMVLLQFDGKRPETNKKLRDAHPIRIREEVIAQLERSRIPMQLTMTVAQGINEEEIGWVIDTGVRHPHIRVIALQPVTYSGRHDSPLDPLNRLTLSDVAKAITRQARLKMKTDDFVPVPCSHPNCGWITLFVRRFGLKKNIVKYVNLEKSMGTVANKALLTSQELQSVVEPQNPGLFREILSLFAKRLIRSTDIFTIAIKPFMDRFSYDQDRVSSCCHHLMDTQGRAVSFCEYNARLRPLDSWAHFPKLGAT
ncbi:MAG: radical SAM protein [bacterium]